ncbi:MAG: hypothetical protein R3F34_04840 [Planctomycetota bacterium]
MPKSITFGIQASPTCVTSTFDGLTSRWTTPFVCACWIAAHTATNSSSRAPA